MVVRPIRGSLGKRWPVGAYFLRLEVLHYVGRALHYVGVIKITV